MTLAAPPRPHYYQQVRDEVSGAVVPLPSALADIISGYAVPAYPTFDFYGAVEGGLVCTLVMRPSVSRSTAVSAADSCGADAPTTGGREPLAWHSHVEHQEGGRLYAGTRLKFVSAGGRVYMMDRVHLSLMAPRTKGTIDSDGHDNGGDARGLQSAPSTPPCDCAAPHPDLLGGPAWSRPISPLPLQLDVGKTNVLVVADRWIWFFDASLWAHVYDTVARRWNTGPRAPSAHDGYLMVALDTRIFAFSILPTTPWNYILDVTEYDIDTGPRRGWELLRDRTPVGLNVAAVYRGPKA